jgi:hypothetical protein
VLSSAYKKMQDRSKKREPDWRELRPNWNKRRRLEWPRDGRVAAARELLMGSVSERRRRNPWGSWLDQAVQNFALSSVACWSFGA